MRSTEMRLSPTALGLRVVRGLVAAGVVGLAAAGPSPASAQKPALESRQPLEIDVQARILDGFVRADASRRKFARLEWRGGLALTSNSSHFGGLSGLVLDADGKRFVAISDAGTWLTGEIVYKGTQPTGIAKARVGPLLAINSRPLTRNRDRDAEAVALLDGSLDKGTLLIAFEGNHRIGRFPIGPQGISAPTGYLPLPAAARRMKPNASFESVGVLQDGPYKGSVLAFAERMVDARGHHTGWLWVRGQPRTLFLTDRAGFDITDIAALRDGRVLVLERRFRWTEGVKMRLRLLEAGDIKPDAIMEGETLLEADMGYEIDNMEGLAVHRDAHGQPVVTIVSDDNFNPLLQRTLLLQFTLLDAQAERKP